MKKIIAMFLIVSLLLSACLPVNLNENEYIDTKVTLESEVTILVEDALPYMVEDIVFAHLGDLDLLRYLEDRTYASIVNLFDSDNF